MPHELCNFYQCGPPLQFFLHRDCRRSAPFRRFRRQRGGSALLCYQITPAPLLVTPPPGPTKLSFTCLLCHSHIHSWKPAAETSVSRCLEARRCPATASSYRDNCVGLRGAAGPGNSLLGIRRTSLTHPTARTMNRMYPMASAAADNDPAAATHPPSFHEDLTLIEAEEEQLRETAWSLLHRRKVGCDG